MFYVVVIISCLCIRQAKSSTKEEMDRKMHPREQTKMCTVYKARRLLSKLGGVCAFYLLCLPFEQDKKAG